MENSAMDRHDSGTHLRTGRITVNGRERNAMQGLIAVPVQVLAADAIQCEKPQLGLALLEAISVSLHRLLVCGQKHMNKHTSYAMPSLKLRTWLCISESMLNAMRPELGLGSNASPVLAHL